MKYTRENHQAYINSVSITLPECHNQSLYLHVFVEKKFQVKTDMHNNLIYGFYSLKKFEQQLLSLKSDSINYNGKNINNNFFHPNLTINLVFDITVWTYGMYQSKIVFA